ncbi:MAG TPA: hypothetical protein VGQ83_39925 [Polyangia bacterium]
MALAAAAPLRAGAQPPGGAAAPNVPAAAREPARVVILDLTFHGIPPELAARYEDALRVELKKAGYDVVERKEARSLLDKLGAPPNCTVGPCLRQVGGILGAHRVLTGAIVAQGSNYDTTLTMLETNRGHAVAQALEHCEVCTVDEGLRSFARVVESLTGRASGTKLQAPARSMVWREPATPWHQQPLWRIGALSIGVAAMAVGGTLLWLDGSCAEGRNCPRQYSTTALGASLIGAGALAAGAGVAMLLIRAPERPRLSLGVGPRGLALCGSF